MSSIDLLIGQVYQGLLFCVTSVTNQVQDKTASKASRVANIKGNRSLEKNSLREEQAFELGKTAPESGSVQRINSKLADDETEEPFKQPTYIELLRRKRKDLKDDAAE